MVNEYTGGERKIENCLGLQLTANFIERYTCQIRLVLVVMLRIVTPHEPSRIRPARFKAIHDKAVLCTESVANQCTLLKRWEGQFRLQTEALSDGFLETQMSQRL